MGLVLLVIAFGALLPVSAAAQQDVLLVADFEADTGGFVSADPVAELSISDDPNLAFEGQGALQLEYVQAPLYPDVPEWGLPGALYLPLPDGAEGLGEIAFALRSKLSTPIIVVLAEGEDGPRYNCLVWCAAGTWNEYSLVLSDFIHDRNGPADHNGRLDPADMTGVAIVDADGFVRMIGEATELFHVEPPAEQTLRLDAFVLRAGEPPTAPSPGGPTALADYSPPMRGLLALGGRDVAVYPEEQEDGEFALRADYTTPAGTLFALAHALRPGVLDGVGAIRFHARTNRRVTLVVTLDERRGPGELNKSSYHATMQVEPADEFKMVTIPLSLFELGDDQTDPDGTLDADLVEMLSIIDATAAFEGSEVINTLRLRAPVAVE